MINSHSNGSYYIYKNGNIYDYRRGGNWNENGPGPNRESYSLYDGDKLHKFIDGYIIDLNGSRAEKNKTHHIVYSDCFKPRAMDYNNLIDYLFTNETFWMEHLKNSKGCWFYKMDTQNYTEAFINPCKKFYFETCAKHDNLVNAISNLYEFLPWPSILKNSLNLPLSGKYHIKMKILPHSTELPENLITALSKFKDYPLLNPLLPTFIELKKGELKALINKTFCRETGLKTIPCLIATEENKKFYVRCFNALYYNSQFIGLIPDEEDTSLTQLNQQGLVEIIRDKVGQKIGSLTLEHIQKLNHLLANSKTFVPPFLIIKTTNFAVSLPKSLLNPEKAGKKRVFKIASEDDLPPAKRRKKEPLPLATTSAPPIIPAQKSPNPFADSFLLPTISSDLPLKGDLFWNNFNLNTLEKISNKILAISSQKSLFREKPQSYPILNLLEQPTKPIHFSPLHPFLKTYQAKEVEVQLSLFQKSISRILAFEMGLGKTFVQAEILAQLIFKGIKGTALFIGPKTVTSQMTTELKNYFAVIACTAWTHLYNETEKRNRQTLLFEAINTTIVAAQINSSETVFSLLPLLSQADIHELYQLLMDPNTLNLNKDCWEKVSILADKFLISVEPTILMEIKNSSTLNIENENEIKDSPYNFLVQLMNKAEWIYRYYEQKPIQMASHTKKGLLNLTQFLLSEIHQADSVKEINEILKTGRGILITHHEAFAQVSEKMMEESEIGALFIDEAQKIHTSKSSRSRVYLQLTSAAKKKNPYLPLLLSTATPFENNFSELWTLLKIANPLANAFEKSTFDLLQKRITSLQKLLENTFIPTDSEEEPELSPELLKYLILTFSHLEAFRIKILTPLLAKKLREDVDVQESWLHNTPTKVQVVVKAQLTEKAQKVLKKAHLDFASRSSGFLNYKHDIQLILLHPRFKHCSFTGNDPKIAKVEKLLGNNLKSLERKMRWIYSSPIAANLIESQPFKDMVQNRQNGLIFVDYLKIASILKKVMDILSTPHQPIEAALMTGEASQSEKNSIVRWFKAPFVGSKVLVAMKKTASIGLNLPEASYVFFPSGDDLNPSVDNQAAARAIRVNSTGLKTLVAFQYENLMYHHTQAIRDVKNKMEKFYHIGTARSLEEQFLAFIELLSAQYFHTSLKKCKDVEQAAKLKDYFEDLLNQLLIQIDEEILESSLQSVMPGFTH